MAEPMLGEIKMFAFNFAPVDYAMCNGQLLPTNQNTSLYSLLGTAFGGDGNTSFSLPDLRGRVSVGRGSYYNRGEKGGEERVTLSLPQMPAHTHQLNGTNEDGTLPVPISNDMLSNDAEAVDPLYSTSPDNLENLNDGICSRVGGGQSHYNLMPFTVINFCIALEGTYPSRN